MIKTTKTKKKTKEKRRILHFCTNHKTIWLPNFVELTRIIPQCAHTALGPGITSTTCEWLCVILYYYIVTKKTPNVFRIIKEYFCLLWEEEGG